jgi:hypothetical protein
MMENTCFSSLCSLLAAISLRIPWALSFWPGQTPAQELRCSASGKRDRSVAISARKHIQDLSADSVDLFAASHLLLKRGEMPFNFPFQMLNGTILGINEREQLLGASKR